MDDRQTSAEALYDEGAYGRRILDNLADCEAYHQYIAGWIAPHLGQLNLEIGAGLGSISAHLPEREGMILCDPSADNCVQMRSRFSARHRTQILHGTTNNIPRETWSRIDTVYSCNVLEHVEDDRGLIADTMETLPSGARFAAVVPAMHMLFGEVDRRLGHFRRYNRHDVAGIAAGLPHSSLVACRYFNAVGALGWYLRYCLLKSTIISEGDGKLVDFLIPIIRRIDHIPPPFGQSLLFVLVKK